MSFYQHILRILVLIVFVLTNTGMTSYAMTSSNANAGTMMSLTPAYHPCVLKGIQWSADDPMNADFILDRGDSLKISSGGQEEVQKLLQLFLAGLTIPAEDLWVNLSPYESDRIIPQALGRTELGKVFLEQDWILKQLTASLLYPDGEYGRKFWEEVYRQALDKFGTADIPVEGFNKVWIVPSEAEVYERVRPEDGKSVAYVSKATLTVMLESDYAAAGNRESFVEESVQSIGKRVMREILIPVLEKEVNEGKHFAGLRQAVYSLILAGWLKQKMRTTESLKHFAGYLDRNKTKGAEHQDADVKSRVYAAYVEAFSKGIYALIREEKDLSSGEIVPRKYISGGMKFDKAVHPDMSMNPPLVEDTADSSEKISVRLSPVVSLSGQDILDFLNQYKPNEVSAHAAVTYQNSMEGMLQDLIRRLNKSWPVDPADQFNLADMRRLALNPKAYNRRGAFSEENAYGAMLDIFQKFLETRRVAGRQESVDSNGNNLLVPFENALDGDRFKEAFALLKTAIGKIPQLRERMNDVRVKTYFISKVEQSLNRRGLTGKPRKDLLIEAAKVVLEGEDYSQLFEGLNAKLDAVLEKEAVGLSVDLGGGAFLFISPIRSNGNDKHIVRFKIVREGVPSIDADIRDVDWETVDNKIWIEVFDGVFVQKRDPGVFCLQVNGAEANVLLAEMRVLSKTSIDIQPVTVQRSPKGSASQVLLYVMKGNSFNSAGHVDNVWANWKYNEVQKKVTIALPWVYFDEWVASEKGSLNLDVTGLGFFSFILKSFYEILPSNGGVVIDDIRPADVNDDMKAALKRALGLESNAPAGMVVSAVNALSQEERKIIKQELNKAAAQTSFGRALIRAGFSHIQVQDVWPVKWSFEAEKKDDDAKDMKYGGIDLASLIDASVRGDGGGGGLPIESGGYVISGMEFIVLDSRPVNAAEEIIPLPIANNPSVQP